MIKVDNVSHGYNGNIILKNILFSVNEGICLGIMGASGSGKSTLSRLLIGLEKAQKGKIFFNGVSYDKMNKNQIRERYKNIQIVFQNAFGAVNPNFTVKDTLFEPLNIFNGYSMKENEKKDLAIEILKSVELSKVSLNIKARKLSGGQLQRLCLARALIVKPKVLILDEALSGLDPLIQYEMLSLLANLKTTFNLTYIFIAHDFMSCYYLCDEILVLDKGKIIEHIKQIGEDMQVKNPQTAKLILPYECKKI